MKRQNDEASQSILSIIRIGTTTNNVNSTLRSRHLPIIDIASIDLDHSGAALDHMLTYVIWTASRNACMDFWLRIRSCSGTSFGLLWLLVLLTAEESWKMSTIQVTF